MSKKLERLRIEGGIGSGLDAEVDLYCDGALASGFTADRRRTAILPDRFLRPTATAERSAGRRGTDPPTVSRW
ncbi:MAG: hypothetical protein R3F36_01780 [Candidatus Competibacteraceae bacterium]